MKTRILYEDKDILVCFKPAGIAVQSARVTQVDVVGELKGYLAAKGRTAVESPGPMARVRCGLPSGREPVYLGIIHRLDQPVSGILVFSKNRKAAAELSRQAADHSMEKVYRARVWTDKELDQEWNELTDYMKKLEGMFWFRNPEDFLEYTKEKVSLENVVIKAKGRSRKKTLIR